MSMFSDFASGFVGGVQKVVDANAEEDRAINRYKKQMEIQEELRKKAEEARVAATRTYLSGFEQGPPTLVTQDFNARGIPVGSARPASQVEQEDFQTKRSALGKQQRLEEEARTMAKEKHTSGLDRDAASIESSRASAASSRAYADNLRAGGNGGAGRASGRPVDPFKDESDLAYLVGTKVGGEQADAKYQQELAAAQRVAQERGADENQLALIRQQLSRQFILELKRLPNKQKEE